MDIVEIVNELRRELERIDGLILALDTLQSGRRRGRPPKLLQQLRAGGEARGAARKKAVRRAAGKRAKKKTRKAVPRKIGKRKR